MLPRCVSYPIYSIQFYYNLYTYNMLILLKAGDVWGVLFCEIRFWYWKKNSKVFKHWTVNVKFFYDVISSNFPVLITLRYLFTNAINKSYFYTWVTNENIFFFFVYPFVCLMYYKATPKIIYEFSFVCLLRCYFLLQFIDQRVVSIISVVKVSG